MQLIVLKVATKFLTKSRDSDYKTFNIDSINLNDKFNDVTVSDNKMNDSDDSNLKIGKQATRNNVTYAIPGRTGLTPLHSAERSSAKTRDGDTKEDGDRANSSRAPSIVNSESENDDDDENGVKNGNGNNTKDYRVAFESKDEHLRIEQGVKDSPSVSVPMDGVNGNGNDGNEPGSASSSGNYSINYSLVSGQIVMTGLNGLATVNGMSGISNGSGVSDQLQIPSRIGDSKEWEIYLCNHIRELWYDRVQKYFVTDDDTFFVLSNVRG